MNGEIILHNHSVKLSIWIAFVYFSFSNSSFGQFDPKQLDGKWISMYQEKGDGSPIPYEEHRNMYYFIEFDNGIISKKTIFHFPNTYRKERWRNDTLEVGNFAMYIERVTSDSLIIIAGDRSGTLQGKIKYYFTSYPNFRIYKDNFLLRNDTFYTEYLFTPELSENATNILDSLCRDVMNDYGGAGKILIQPKNNIVKVIYTDHYKSFENRSPQKNLKDYLQSSFEEFDLTSYTNYNNLIIDFQINEKLSGSKKNLFLRNIRYFEELDQKKRTISTEAEYYYLEGKTYYNKGNKSKSLECFKYASKLDPKFVDALYNAAAISFELGKHKQACKYWQQLSDLKQKLGIELLNKNCKD